MRRTLALAAAAALTFAIAACGDGGRGESAASMSPAPTPISDQEFIDRYTAGWVPSARNDPDAALQSGKKVASLVCSDIRESLASGKLDTASTAAENGAELEKLAAVHSPGRMNTFPEKRAGLLFFASYGCPEVSDMVQSFVDYADTQPIVPSTRTYGESQPQPRPASFNWKVNGVYNAGPQTPGARNIPVGYYLISAQNGYSAWYVDCTTPECGVGGVDMGDRLEPGERYLFSMGADSTNAFRNAVLEPEENNNAPSPAATVTEPPQPPAPSTFPTNGTVRVGYEAGMIPPGTYEVRIGENPLVPMAQWVRCSKITCTQDNVIDFGIVQESEGVGYLEIDGTEVAIKVIDAVLTPYVG